MEERLQKLLSQWGIASRRRSEQMIEDGRVRLNGNVVGLGSKADPARDRIEVDGITIKANPPKPIYLLLNKPMGVVSTCHDPQGRKTVLDLLPGRLRRGRGIHPVGRLDAESTGAIILTNDGALTFRLTHPGHCISKTYRVWLQGSPPDSVLRAWREGIDLDSRRTLPARVRILQRVSPERTQIEVVLNEGRNRQIRRVADALGYPVLKLHRVAIGSIRLQSRGQSVLSFGKYRSLTHSELSQFDTRSA
ncbi:rRNA pseudouridine synthase [Oscillatoriales cyanobacterium LEGE 11467]|uniref:Pseudouridine synthase n=1 Tax=Zarconia navalis LEGE 11467 TaxID=1828826 RepID=A0A928VX62_9CYAN|nr:pseudouridine synthase [Zarconia navalis]MBE9039901.1 rRNA pseudouridine synthase [Zarconia navalis LEGE 11467]